MTETVNLVAFASIVQPYAPAAPWPTVMAQLRRSVIEFCERTRIWRHVLNVTIEANDEIVVAPQYAAVHDWDSARFNDDIDLTPIHFTDVTRWAETGKPRWITQVTPNTVRVVPFEAGTLELSVFLKPIEGHAMTAPPGEYPIDSYDLVPKFLLTNYGEVIAAGALARILMLPGQEYSNPAMAQTFAARFDRAASKDFGAHLKGQQRAPVRTKSHFF